MKNLKSVFLSLLMLTASGTGTLLAQESLTLSAAIERTLKNNFFISISRNDSLISDNNNTIGNAGFLPTLDATAGVSTSVNNTEQEYSNGSTVKRDGAGTDNINAALRLNWTLFDGMRMFAAKSRLAAAEENAGYRLKNQIENVVSDLILAYFDVVRLQQAVRVMEETIRINDERVRIAQARFETGAASKLDFLQARVDRDARLSELMRMKNQLDESISTVNRLMGSGEFTPFTASDSISFTYRPDLSELTKSVNNRNSEILSQQSQFEMNRSLVNEYKASRFPWLNANVSYSYGRTENEVGFALLNQNQGLSAGLTLTWNLFGGFNTSREVKNAKLNVSTANLLLSEAKARISQQLAVAFRKYESDQAIVELEQGNLQYARENADVSLEAFRIGSISGIQLREAQNSYEQALLRLIEARYQAKISETVLMKLNGDLVR